MAKVEINKDVANLDAKDREQEESTEDRSVLCRLKNEDNENIGPILSLQLDLTSQKLTLLANKLLEKDPDDEFPFTFVIRGKELQETLGKTLEEEDNTIQAEDIVDIICQQQSNFRVRGPTRCSSSLPGHEEAVLSVQFSPDGRYLASCSGDKTVRFWDINTETPHHKCEAHTDWVLTIAWSPNGRKLASGCKNSQICIWDPQTGKQMGRTLTGHRQWITWLCWKPLHLDRECRLLASASKDATVKIWDTILMQCTLSLSGHMQCITCIRWGGHNLLYTASQDRTIKVYRPNDGTLCRTLTGHGHWVNYLALNTDYVLRTASFDPAKAQIVPSEQTIPDAKLAELAKKRYDEVLGKGEERMVSASDDFTMYLWNPESEKKPVARMTGHQQPINQVLFSPDGRLVASASFDKSVKLWNGRTGEYVGSLRGHVQRVYQVAWSADSRLVVTGSADSTLKLWDLKQKKLRGDLPGHADEVYAVDWSPDGQKVVSGSKDKMVKIWRQ